MKKYIKLISLALAATGMTVICNAEASNMEKQTVETRVEQYYNIAESENLFKIYRSYELTPEILTNRKGTIIVEEVIGKCINEKTGDGFELGKEHDYYNYISYKNVKGVKAGDIVCSYFIFNPDNNFEDDIIERYDFIVDSAEKRIKSVDGKFHNSFGKYYQFKSNDDTVWWALTTDDIGFVPAADAEYTLYYDNNGTTTENKNCDCKPECECEVYDDIFLGFSIKK